MNKRLMKWLLCAAGLAGFFLLALNLNNLTAMDSGVYAALSPCFSPAMNRAALVFTALASPLVLLLITLPVVFLLPKKEYRIPLLLNLTIAVLLNLGLKSVFTRPRPLEVARLVTESGYSFPSGHTMAACCFYGFLIYLLWKLCQKGWLRGLLTAVFCAVIGLVAFSRVYLGAHYFSDVLAGLCVSVSYLVIFTSFVERFFAAEAERQLVLPGSFRHHRLLLSFSYALQGVAAGLKTERNMVVHFGAMAVVVVFGVLLGISATEWMICILLFGVVFMAELFNTALETVVDMICPRPDPKAKLAKDTAAGAVLFVAMAAAVIGLIIFFPRLYALVQAG